MKKCNNFLAAILHRMNFVVAVVIMCMSVSDMAASTSAIQNITQKLNTKLLPVQGRLIKCSMKENERSTLAFLTCFFPVDIRHAKLQISIRGEVKNDTSQDAVLVLHCFWLESLACTKKENYVLLNEDQIHNNATIQIPIEETRLYNFSCHVTGRDYNSDQCSLVTYEKRDIPTSAQESPPDTKIVVVVVVVTVCLLVVSITCLINIWRYKRRRKKCSSVNQEETNNSETPAHNQSTHEANANGHLISPEIHIVSNENETDPLLKANDSEQETNGNYKFNHIGDGIGTVSREKTNNDGQMSSSSHLLQIKPRIRSRPVSVHTQVEDLKLWISKQCDRLSAWKIITKDEQEIDRRLKKCLKLEHAISKRMGVGHEAYDRDLMLETDDLSGQVTLEGLLTEAKKTLDILTSQQNVSIRKKVNASIRSTVQKDMDRLQIIDTFIALARKQADDALSIEEDSEGKEIEAYVVKMKTVTELQMLLEHHETCLQKGIQHQTLSRKAEYEKKQSELVTLREKFVDLKTMFESSLKQALTNHALLYNSENSSTQTQSDTLSEECLHVTDSTIPSQKMDAETKADNEQPDKKSEDCLLATESTIPSKTMDVETKADSEQTAILDQQFPGIDTGKFCIPSKHIRHVHTTSTLIGSKALAILVDPTTSHQSTRLHINDLEDIQEKLHKCLSQVMETTAQSDAMMAITQTNFGLYDKQAIGVPDAVVDENNPDNILKLKTTYSDLIILDKQRGILGGIVQSFHFTDPTNFEKELTNSVSKLKDAERIIKEGIKTIPKDNDVAVRMTLILPNISKTQLDGKLAKAVQNVNCLYKDDMNSGDWWDAIWLPRQSDTMSNNLYRNLVVRFALPAIKMHNSLHKPDPKAEPKEGDTAGDYLQTQRQQSPLGPEEGKMLDFDALDEAHDDVKFMYGDETMTILLHLRAEQWLSHFNARTFILLQTTEDWAPDLPDSTNLQTAHATYKHVDISKLYSKDPDHATVVLKEEGKETLLAALGLSPPGQPHIAIHILADKADGDVVAAVYKWLKDQDVKTVRLWAAGKNAPRNNEDGRLPVQQHSKHPIKC